LGSLDGLRGVAALLVMLMHAGNLLGAHLLDRAYLMVDLFFLMSGFVLASAYGDRLASAGGRAKFVRNRLLRLYPLALVSLLLGAAVDLIVAACTGQPPHARFVLIFALSAAFLPALSGGLLVPLNGPLWSLQAELWSNFAFAAVAPWLTTRRLTVLVAVMGIVLAIAALLTGSLNGGYANNDAGRGAGPWSFALGYARIGFSFPLGVLLHRMWQDGRIRARPTVPPTLLIPVVLLAIAIIPVRGWAGLDLLMVMTVFPALLIVVADSTPKGRSARILAWLGGLSYPLYVMHGPVLALVNRLTPAGTAAPVWIGLIGFGCIASIAAAAGVERWIDRPIRVWAARRSAASQSVPQGDRVLVR
jgi:peptidoglycan/LPS O-acetylase OafA/YrhL